MVGWQVCLCASLAAQEQGPLPCGGGLGWIGLCPDPACLQVEAETAEFPMDRPDDAKPVKGRRWAFGAFGQDCPCLGAVPGTRPAAPHWHGALRKSAHGQARPLNLVVEVLPIELNDASGSPRGTFR
jgi:hypothetical protein